MVNAKSRPLYPRQCPGIICIGRGWVPGPFLMGAKNLTPTGIRSPDPPARSESLYRLLRYLIAFGTHCVPGNDEGTKRHSFLSYIYNFYAVVQQPTSGLGRLVLRFLHHTQLDTHTHIRARARGRTPLNE